MKPGCPCKLCRDSAAIAKDNKVWLAAQEIERIWKLPPAETVPIGQVVRRAIGLPVRLEMVDDYAESTTLEHATFIVARYRCYDGKTAKVWRRQRA